jgi:hypothetical protein
LIHDQRQITQPYAGRCVPDAPANENVHLAVAEQPIDGDVGREGQLAQSGRAPHAVESPGNDTAKTIGGHDQSAGERPVGAVRESGHDALDPSIDGEHIVDMGLSDPGTGLEGRTQEHRVQPFPLEGQARRVVEETRGRSAVGRHDLPTSDGGCAGVPYSVEKVQPSERVRGGSAQAVSAGLGPRELRAVEEVYPQAAPGQEQRRCRSRGARPNHDGVCAAIAVSLHG